MLKQEKGMISTRRISRVKEDTMQCTASRKHIDTKSAISRFLVAGLADHRSFSYGNVNTLSPHGLDPRRLNPNTQRARKVR